MFLDEPGRYSPATGRGCSSKSSDSTMTRLCWCSATGGLLSVAEYADDAVTCVADGADAEGPRPR